MQSIVDIQKLIKDREDILEVLRGYEIEVLKIEKKNKMFVITLGGIDKILYQNNRIEIEDKLKSWQIIWK